MEKLNHIFELNGLERKCHTAMLRGKISDEPN